VLLARCLHAHEHPAGVSQRLLALTSDIWSALTDAAQPAGSRDGSERAGHGPGSVPALLRECREAASKPRGERTELECGWRARLACSVIRPLPLPSLCCNNPVCPNVHALCEMHLVAGKGLCAHCGAARYCSKACQKAHWPAHKDTSAWLRPVP
jgi:hypothetical protein